MLCIYIMQSRLVRLFAGTASELEEGKYTCNMDTRDLSNVRALAMKTCTFRNNVYNIFTSGPNKNNVFEFEIIADGTYNVTVPLDGFYTAQQLIDIVREGIETRLKIIEPSAVVNMSVNEYTKKIQIEIGVVLQQVVLHGTAGLNRTLGNKENSGSISGFGDIYHFDSFASLGGLTHVTVSLRSKTPKTILNSSPLEFLYTNSLGVVPVTADWGRLQEYIQPDLGDAVVKFTDDETLTDLQFTVRDPYGNLLQEQATDFMLELTVFF